MPCIARDDHSPKRIGSHKANIRERDQKHVPAPTGSPRSGCVLQ
jgi:hypothetical protein